MDWLTVLSLASTLIFGLLSVVFYLKAIRFKQIVVLANKNVVQVKTHPRVNIRFGRKKIERLARLLVIVFNRGTEEIRRSDIPLARELTLTLNKECQILSWGILATSNPAIRFDVSRAPANGVSITFDYLNRNDGGVIEILFEEPNDSLGKLLDVSANVIGGKDPVVGSYVPPPSSKRLIAFAIFMGIQALVTVYLMIKAYKYTMIWWFPGFAVIASFLLIWLGMRMDVAPIWPPKFARKYLREENARENS